MKRENYSIDIDLAANQNIKEKNFWLTQLSGEPVKVNFPYDYKRKDNDESRFDEVTFGISGDIGPHLQKLSCGSSYTLNTILVTVVVVLLHKYTGSTDIIVGAPIYRQDHNKELINRVLALRKRFETDITFKKLLMQVGRTIVETTENYNYPIELLLRELNIPFVESGDFPLFDIVVLLENIHDKNDIRHIHTNMIFSFIETAEAVSGVLKYNSLLYNRETIEGIVSHLIVLLKKGLGDVELKISDIDIVTEEEKTKLLIDFNATKKDYPRHRTLHEMFEEQVEKSPDHIALVIDHQNVSYDNLNQRANRLARVLRRNGVGADGIVGLLIHRSLDMMVAILGILKGGGAYLPIEPDTPKKRILSMLTDCRASLLLTDTACVKHHAFKGLQELQSTGPALWETPPRPQILDFNRLPIPNRSLVNYEIYNRNIGQAMFKNCISLQATRGCPYHCLYCHKIWPKKHVIRSAEHIFEEVLFYYKMGIRRFAFIDDVFNLNVENSSRFFQLVIKNKLDIQVAFPNGIRGDILSKNYIDLMVDAGTIILAFALETASPRLQKLVGKNLNLEKFRENLEYFCEKYPHIIMELFTMHGFPSETKEEAMMTLNFIKSIKWLHFPFVFILKIYPDTDMARFALENGVTLEQIYRSENLLYNELPETLPFEKRFTLEYQSDFFNNYILLKERLLHVLPYQMNILSEDEIIQQYNSYIPNKIDSFDNLLDTLSIKKEELKCESCQDDMLTHVPHLHKKMKNHFPPGEPESDALRVLLLDLSQYFSENRDIFYDMIEPPLGLMYLMTYLKQQLGHKINGKVAKSRIDFDNYKELKKILEAFKPDVIGIRTLSLFKDFFHETVTVIRNWGIDVPIIAGGPYGTSSYQEVLQNRNVDLVVRGEGEVTFCELITKIIENDGKLPPKEILKEINGIAFIPRESELEREGQEILIMEELEDMMSKNPIENLTPVNGSKNLAYIIFTSGSTGKPKGVLTTHDNVTRVVKNTNYIELNPVDRILQLSNYAFDGSVFDIYGALLNGAALVMMCNNNSIAVDEVAHVVRKEKITVFFVTTALFNMLVKLQPHCLKDIRKILFGGERVSLEYASKALEYLGKKKVIHMYGPTETTVYASFYPVNEICKRKQTVPIGIPLSNTTVYILDKNLKLVPIGGYGEIYIGGDGLARGYLNNQELTYRKFVDHPLAKGNLLYKTGDLARWLHNGDIEFIGRIDHQVKIRGFRIELGEIEYQLLKHENIKEAVVLVRKANEDSDYCDAESGDRYLWAYIVADEKLEIPVLKNYLSMELPNYMIPANIEQLDKMPLTSNGKIDKKALADLELKAGIEYVPPGDEVEEKMTEIWSAILGIDKNIIGMETNFFDLGGNSLNATLLLSGIHEAFNASVPLKEIFRAPYIKDLSQYIKKASKDEFTSIEVCEKKEYYELSSAQKRLFVMQQMGKSLTHYNIPAVLVLEGKINKEKFEEIFNQLIERHDAFRTSFVLVNDKPIQKICDHVEFKIGYQNPEGENGASEERIIEDFIQPFDLLKAPLLKVGLIRREEEKHLLMVDMHHIISDGVSQEIFTDEFHSLYAGNDLPLLKLQYKDYAQWQNSEAQKERLKVQEQFWLKQLTGELPVLNLPMDYERPSQRSFEGSMVNFAISSDETDALINMARIEGVTLYTLLLTIFYVFLFKLTRQETIIVGTDIAGRRHADLNNICGMIVNTLALMNYPSGHKTFRYFLHEIKTRTLEAFENQEYQFDDLVETLGVKRDSSRNPIFDVIFSFQNLGKRAASTPVLETTNLKLKPYELKNNTSQFDLNLVVMEDDHQLLLSFLYCTELFKEETINRFISYFKQLVTEIIMQPEKRLSEFQVISSEDKSWLLEEIRKKGGKYLIPADHGDLNQQVNLEAEFEL